MAASEIRNQLLGIITKRDASFWETKDRLARQTVLESSRRIN